MRLVLLAIVLVLGGCGTTARTTVTGGSASVTRTTITYEPPAPAPVYVIRVLPPEKPDAPAPDPVPADGPAPKR